MTPYRGLPVTGADIRGSPGSAGRVALADGGRAERAGGLERLHDVASDPELTRAEKIDRMLAVGCEELEVACGFLTRIEDGTQEIRQSVGDLPELQPGRTAPVSEAYCRRTLGEEQPLAVSDAVAEGWGEDPAYERFGLDCYLGATIYVDGEQYGTVCFADTEPRGTPFTDRERTFVDVVTNWIHYLLEQQAYEREVEQQRAFTESLMDSLPDPLYALDESGAFLRWNDRLEAVTGYGADELASMRAPDLVADRDRDRVADAIAVGQAGERTSVEAALETRDGPVPYELSVAPLYDGEGNVVGVTGLGRDVSDRRAQEKRLSGLLDATRSLMQARDREHVAEIAVNAARSVLGFDINVFRLYDSDREALDPAAATEAATDAMGKRPVYDVDEGYPGEVFASGEPRFLEDVDGLGTVRSAMYYPVGVHGTISVGATRPDAFDGTDRQVLALLATSAAAACTRAKREREVREAREHTEHVLERVNGLLRDVIEVLVEARTREELEAGVVREIAAADPYTFAWIGRPDVASETLSPTAWGGTAGLPVADHSVDLGSDGDPVADAYRDGTPRVLTGLDATARWGASGDAPVEALLAVPLVYRETTYGVLAVFTDDAGAFDERERAVLEALGRAVANAINAVERGRILDATEIIELEFAITDAGLLFARLSTAAGCTLELEESEYRPDGSLQLYLTGRGVDAATLVDLARDDDAVREAVCIVEHDEECLLEVVVEESLLATLTEYGAVPRAVTAENGTVRFTVELPYEAEARELFELVEEEYPATELLGYHERERPVETRQEFAAALSEQFTDRQEAALRTAYLGGFFDWPRGIDGNELADSMDITRPTYHQHLRAAQRKVFEELFE